MNCTVMLWLLNQTSDYCWMVNTNRDWASFMFVWLCISVHCALCARC